MKSKKYRLFTWNELLDADFPAEMFWLDPYIVKGGITHLFGPKSTGKSPLQWGWAHAIATGELWLGLPTCKGRVLIIETDQPAPTVAKRLNYTGKRLTEGVWFWEGPPLNVPAVDPGVMAELAHMREVVKPDVVFFNTLRNTTLLPLEDGTTCRLVYGWARETFPGASLVFIHHPKKEPPSNVYLNMDEMFSGSNAWRNDAQIALHLRRTGRVKRRVQAMLRMTGSQVGPIYSPLPMSLSVDGSTWDSPLFENLKALKLLQEELGLEGHALDKAAVKAHIFGGITTARKNRLRMEQGFPGSSSWLGIEEGGGDGDDEGEEDGEETQTSRVVVEAGS